jgi:Flp pilus assembly protein TadD
MQVQFLGVLIVLLAVGAIEVRAQTPQDDAARAKTHLVNGLVSLDRGDVNGAIRELRQATVLLPNVGRLHYEYGRALAEDGDTEEAMKEFRRAIQLTPDDPDPHLALAGILTRADTTRAEGIAEYRAALRLRPEDPESRRRLGNALVRGQTVEMLKQMAELIEKNGRLTAQERALVQDLFAKSPAMRSGLAELRKAIELKPNWALPHHDLAVALKRFGDQRGAVAEYQLACNL